MSKPVDAGGWGEKESFAKASKDDRAAGAGAGAGGGKASIKSRRSNPAGFG